MYSLRSAGNVNLQNLLLLVRFLALALLALVFGGEELAVTVAGGADSSGLGQELTHTSENLPETYMTRIC